MAEERCKSLMEEYKVKPHVVPLTTVVAAYCTDGDTREAERVVREMMDVYDVNPNERTFSHVIWAHGQREDVASIRRVALWMIDLGFRIDRGDTKTALFRALQECGLGRNAVENLIQDVANHDVIRKRHTENGNQRLYDRSNDDNETVRIVPPETSQQSQQQRQQQQQQQQQDQSLVRRRSIAVGGGGGAPKPRGGTGTNAFKTQRSALLLRNTLIARTSRAAAARCCGSFCVL
jgi:pentatricopeptide repeat protein